MKKMYESPVAEKIEFRYADQVVASNGGQTTNQDMFSPGCNPAVTYPKDGAYDNAVCYPY